jgi:hypothetical protein
MPKSLEKLTAATLAWATVVVASVALIQMAA